MIVTHLLTFFWPTTGGIPRGKVKKRHSKRYEFEIGGAIIIAPSLRELEEKVAAWRAAHPPKPAPVPKAPPKPKVIEPPPKLSKPPQAQEAAPKPVVLPLLPPVPTPSLAEGAALLEHQRQLEIAAQAQQNAILEAYEAEVLRLRELEEDDLAAIQAILELVA